MTYAAIADLLSIAYWLLVLGVVAAGFAWLWQFVDHMDWRRGWSLIAITVALVLACRWIGAQEDHYRELAPNFAPGEGIGFFTLMFMGLVPISLFIGILFSGTSKSESH